MSPAKHPHTIKPPCFTVGTTHVEIICSPTLRLTNTRRLEPKISNLDSSGQRTDFHLSNVHCSCLLAQASLFFLLVSLVVVSLQQFDHEGLIHTVSSEQLMLRCVCYLSSVKNLFGLQFLRPVIQMNLSSAAEVTLGLPFLWRSS